MFAAESAPMETDSAMVKRRHGRPTNSRIVLQFVERCAREALLSQRLNTGLVPK
jgi:hypothetical protein